MTTAKKKLDNWLITRHKVTRQEAIRLRCLDCVGGQQAEVKRCTSLYCPIWAYRMAGPWQSPLDYEINTDGQLCDTAGNKIT